MASNTQSASPEQLLEHADWLRMLARALVREPGDADDLAQETYEAALANPPQADRPVRPWLAGVMRNLARFRARTSARRQRREQAAERLEQRVASPEELVARVETQKLVADLVVGLDEPFRSTILLRYYEGYSAAEIARRLDIPAGTVRWRLKRGLDELRIQLDDSFSGGRQRWLAALAPIGAVSPKDLAGGTIAPITQGLIVMKASTKALAAVAVIVGLVATGYFAGLFGKSKAGDKTAATTASKKQKPPSKFTTQSKPALRFSASPNGVSVTLAGAAPDGTLRLEGQVIDDAERPVAGAIVAIGTNPARQTATESDGSFVFAKLSARTYELEARAGGLHAYGSARLTANSDPVILRARPGGKISVLVRTAGDNKPVAGAAVELRSTLMWQAHTNAQGKVEFDGIGPGWRRLQVSANGYAVATRMITSASRRAAQTVTVVLESGTAVGGKVVDSAGKPVAGARVWATFASEPFPTIDPRIDAVTSDAKGIWRMPALVAGTYHFIAAHPDHAQTSSAPTYVGGDESMNIELKLRAGGVVSGKVMSKAGPVAGAEVRVVAKGALAWRFRSQTVSAADGSFRLGGLPLRAVDVVAVHDSGSSDIASVDLAANAKGEVTLQLSIADAIAGLVVDAQGDAVAEALVAIQPVFSGALGERRAWSVRRHPRVRTGKDGRFRFAGLPKGSYKLRAARPDALPNALWLHAGVKASPGGDDVRLEVPGETSYTGRVQFDDGSSPLSFTVQLGRTAPTPFASKDGSFSIAAPAGPMMLSIAGPSFITHRAKLSAAAGEPKDLGTITVKRGRAVKGTVVDADGSPVANAEVAAGRLLTGGGRELNIRSEGIGVHTTKTDDKGAFLISGFDERPFTVVAGLAGKGRSTSLHVPRGKGDVTVKMKLEPTGALSGVASLDGKPLPQTAIIASPRGATLSNFFVITGEDGSFALDMLTPGRYIVQAMLGGGANKPKDMHIFSATVKAGERTKVDMAIKTGSIEVTVNAKTDTGKPVPFAMVGLAMGKLDGTPNLEVARNNYPKGERGAFFLRMSMGGRPAVISSIPPGVYSACVIPIADPAMLRSPAGTNKAPAKCVSKTLGADPAKATYNVTVPEKWTKR